MILLRWFFFFWDDVPLPFRYALGIILLIFNQLNHQFSYDVRNCAGKNCLLWFGPTPTILILDPNLIKEMLSKNYIFHKLSGTPLARKLGKGVSLYQNHKWAKHRRLLDPSLRLKKLKVQCKQQVSIFPAI